MPRSSAQSDFAVVRAPDPQLVLDALPPTAGSISLPHAQLRSNEGSALATRWLMRATFVMLLALLVLCGVGLHLPSGG